MHLKWLKKSHCEHFNLSILNRQKNLHLNKKQILIIIDSSNTVQNLQKKKVVVGISEATDQYANKSYFP
jgi:ribose 5-phosphate isomerase